MMLLAVLNFIVGIFGIFFGITIDFVLIGGELTLVSSFQLGAIIIGIFQIIAGYGLWKLKTWAWVLSVAITFIGLIINIGIVLVGFSIQLVREYFLVMLMRLIILVYLMKESIRVKFR